MNRIDKHSKLRWLIIRNGAIGDTILISPVLQAIRAKVQDVYIEVMGNLERVELLVGDGLADHAVSFEQSGMESLFVDDQPLPTYLIQYFSRFDVILYYGQSNLECIQTKLNVKKSQIVITYPALPMNDNIHITEHYLQAIQNNLNIQQTFLPKVVLRQEEIEWGKTWLNKQFHNIDDFYILGIHAGAGSKTKQVPFQYFYQKIEVIRTKHNPLIILPKGPADTEAVVRFLQSMSSKAPYIVAEDLRLRQLAAVLSNCHEWIGNDSGITHLAAAIGTAATAFFVSSNPKVWKPLGMNVKVQTISSLE